MATYKALQSQGIFLGPHPVGDIRQHKWSMLDFKFQTWEDSHIKGKKTCVNPMLFDTGILKPTKPLESTHCEQAWRCICALWCSSHLHNWIDTWIKRQHNFHCRFNFENSFHEFLYPGFNIEWILMSFWPSKQCGDFFYAHGAWKFCPSSTPKHHEICSYLLTPLAQ